jgi:hypothetical protein
MAIFYNPNKKKGLFYAPSGATGGAGGGGVLSIEYSATTFCDDGTDPIPGITGQTGGTFSSTTGLVFISTSTGQVDLSASTPGTYVVTYTAPNSNTATTSISIDAVPVVSAGADVAICINNNTILTATGATTYSWSTGETTASITVEPTTNTTYTVTGFNGVCSATDSVDVTVNPLPSVSISGALTYCVGATTTLDAGSFVSYLWSNGETTQTISATAGSYTVTVTDSNGCSNTSAQVTVTELTLPTVAITGTLLFCTGGSTTLTASAGLSSYLWSSGETTQAINVTSAGGYSVTGTDSNGCSNTSATSTVIESPLDDATFAYSDSSYAQNFPDPTPTITGLTGGTFSAGSGLVFVDSGSNTGSSTGEIDLSASTIASYTVTYTTAGTCPNTSTQTVGITAALAQVNNVYSMNFDGTNDFIDAGNITDLNSQSAVSTSAWINPQDTLTTTPVVLAGGISSTNRFYIQLLNSTTIRYVSSGSSGNIVDVTVPLILDGNWHHIATIHNGTSLDIYFDGVKINSTPLTITAVSANMGDNFTIGAYFTRTSNFLNSYVDEVGLFNTALTAQEVQSIYLATETGKTADLNDLTTPPVAWYRM